MTLGDFAAFNSYLVMLIFPIMMIGFMSNIIAQASASYQRITDVLNAPESGDHGTVSTIIRGDIRLKDVSLSYEDKPVLKNISFSIKAGSKTAIIGPTAAGKSQLLYLLTGLIPSGHRELSNSTGLIPGHYTREMFYSQIGFVFQDSVIFNMTLRENIAFSDKVTDESLAKAIETAELKDFIDSLPDGLDTVVSERGTSLSGGQKQRIMLARALAIEPKVLLLDDFTSRVDRKTENRILCNLQNNYPDLTLISVTQKIAPVKHFEQIILLMEGEVIATGSTRNFWRTPPNMYRFIIHNEARTTMNYNLYQQNGQPGAEENRYCFTKETDHNYRKRTKQSYPGTDGNIYKCSAESSRALPGRLYHRYLCSVKTISRGTCLFRNSSLPVYSCFHQ